MIRNRNKNKDHRQNLRRRGGNILRWIYRILFVVFLAVAFHVLFLSGKLSIIRVEVSGTGLIDREELRQKIQEQLEGNYFQYISKKNLILTRPDRIEDRLKSDYKLIKSVEIRKKFPTELLVEVIERKLVLSFCNSQGCFSLDESGTAFERITSEEADQKMVPVLEDKRDDDISEGESVMDDDSVRYISAIEGKIREVLDIALEKKYETPNRISGDIRVKTVEEWFIYFNQSIALEKEIDMLRLVLGSKINQGRDNLEYIDLRSENKVFYKYKEGTEEEMKSGGNSEEEKIEEEKDEKKKKKK